MIKATILLDSINEYGNRLTTFELHYPRFIHEELMTHRTFSRNASSTRAVPTKKLIAEAVSDDLRAEPVEYRHNSKGMQGGEPLRGYDLAVVKNRWRKAALQAATIAEGMAAAGADKQTVNRILMPFIHIHVVVTATEYMNFFGLRLDAGADPTMRALAEAMWAAYATSTPRLLKYGEWHLPYADAMHPTILVGHQDPNIKVSVARCCRVSYRSFDTGKHSTFEEDLALYERIAVAVPMHASPCEHQATPAKFDKEVGMWEGDTTLWGNFQGWIQYRKTLSGEACAPLPEAYREAATK